MPWRSPPPVARRSPVTAVVFDADDTLVDTSAAVDSALRVVLAEMRRLTPAAAAVTLADLAADWEIAFTELAVEPTPAIRRAALARSLARAGLAVELDRVTELFFSHRFAVTRLFPDVPDVLPELCKSYLVGYATNGPNRTHQVGLAGVFAFEVYAHVDGVPKKPAPGFFDAVLAGAGCGADSVVHVGDDWANDVAGAAAAGFRAVWLNRTGRPRPATARVTPAAEIRSLAELPAVLARL